MPAQLALGINDIAKSRRIRRVPFRQAGHQTACNSGAQLLDACDMQVPIRSTSLKDSPMAPRAASKTAESSDKVSVICRALRRAIIEQALEPGAKLPEDSLGERFGVSRTIARHALGQLAAEGLVELRRNRIAVVATPSWQDARDAFDIRIELERLVVRQLAGKLTKAQIVTLNSHVDAEDAARDGSDAVSIRLATEFHILLASMSNTTLLVRYVTEVAYRCCLTLSLYSRPHSSECAINEHRAIIAALVKGDEDKVMGLMHPWRPRGAQMSG